MFPLEFCGVVNHEETRVKSWGFSEDRMIVQFESFWADTGL